MIGERPSTHTLDKRRRQLLYRAAHRGTREMDILLGGYVAASVAHMDEEELARMETLMDEPDDEMLNWLTGRAAPPAGVDATLIAAITAFHRRRSGR